MKKGLVCGIRVVTVKGFFLIHGSTPLKNPFYFHSSNWLSLLMTYVVYVDNVSSFISYQRKCL